MCARRNSRCWRDARSDSHLQLGECYLYGYGDVPAVLIKDQLKIPATLKGDYVLSWRWDCEQTDQIWSTCADITVTA